MTVHALSKSRDANKPNFHGIIRGVEILGFDEKPEFTIDGMGMHVFTRNVESDFPVVFKIITE
ncbi:MAG: hypothetical protein NC416_11225 [Eubacterium sp.]|nr:hypothetical protein [Eubacterium sp.]